MADFTSTQTGNWNDGGTWGNTSPGVKGTDYPGAGDTATMAHTVTYNAGDSTDAFGNVTINSGGVLTFPINSNSTINFNTTAILTINSGGELRAGANGSPIGSAYHCYFHWAQGSSARYVLVLNTGGTINIYGDPAFYGSARYAELDSNWTTGQSFYVSGDYSSKWQSGQKFYIHENIDYDNYQNDGHIYTIDTVSAYDSGNDRTTITITEAAPGITFTAVHATTSYQSKLIMISRNIELTDPSAPLGVYNHASYSERLRFNNNQGSTNKLINVQDALIAGWERGIYGGYNYKGINLCFISNYYGINSGTGYQITGDFISNYYGISAGTNHQIAGDFVSNNYGINSGINHQITGDFVSNYRSVYQGANLQITGDFISNRFGISSGTSHQITGDLLSNNQGFYYGTNHQVTGDLNNTLDIFIYSNAVQSSILLEDCTTAGANRRALKIVGNSGVFLNLITGDTNFQTPPSSNDWVFEAVPNSY